MDDCDVNDYKSYNYLGDSYECSIMGNSLTWYEPGYKVWVSIQVKFQDEYYTLSDETHILLRSEIDDFISFMHRYNLKIYVWGGYNQNHAYPKRRFNYTGGIHCGISRESVDDFTINDDFFLKCLYPNSKYKDIWSLANTVIKHIKHRRLCVKL